MFCRKVLLNIQQETTATTIDRSLVHLRVLSSECFAEPLAEGISTTTSPELSPSSHSCLQTLTLSPLHLFYTDVGRVCDDIAAALQCLSEDLEGLAQCVCDCLQKAPLEFGSTELKITESKEVTDVSRPDAAFLVVSCVEEKSDTSAPPR